MRSPARPVASHLAATSQAMIEISGKTHIGRRKTNEDRIVADSEWGLALVADGMGGAGSGDVASQIVARTVTERIGDGDSLEQAITNAHDAVMAAADAGHGNKGMGSTVVVAQFDGNEYRIAWIGDSRAYLFDGESLFQLTRDHSQLEHLLAIGELQPADAEDYPAKNVITRAMGIPWHAGEPVPVIRGSFARGQQLLLCSDGLHDAAGEATMLRILKANGEDMLQNLVDAALDVGGSDNISVVLCTPNASVPATGVVPEPVAIVRDGGEREYFLATAEVPPEAAPKREIETTRIQMVQPGAVNAVKAAVVPVGNTRTAASLARIIGAAIIGVGVAWALFYFDII